MGTNSTSLAKSGWFPWFSLLAQLYAHRKACLSENGLTYNAVLYPNPFFCDVNFGCVGAGVELDLSVEVEALVVVVVVPAFLTHCLVQGLRVYPVLHRNVQVLAFVSQYW